MYVWKHIKFKFVKETCYKVKIKSKMQILDIRCFDLKIISQNFTRCFTAIDSDSYQPRFYGVNSRALAS